MRCPRLLLPFTFVCLLIALISLLMLAQSNPTAVVNQSNGIAPSAPRSPRRLPFGQGRTIGSMATASRPGASPEALVLDFASAVTYGSGAFSVAVADVNGDGKPDIVVANGTVGVLLGNGDGTFQTEVTYGSGGSAYSVAVADVNGDGKPDIVVANNDDIATVGVLLGNGDGTFQTAVTYGTGATYAYSVAVADVNGDGKPDIVVANWCSNGGCKSGTVSVLLGNGDGTFQTAVTYGTGGIYADSVAVADVNGDGKLDIVAGNYGNNNVAVLLGNGDGTFQAAMTYDSGGSNPYSVAVADVNGDGKPDIVVANHGSSNVGVLLGNGDGTFQTAVAYGAGGSGAQSVAVADVNGDGKPDIVVANYNSPGTVGVLLGNGDGTFQTAVTYGSGGSYPDSVAVADVNGDGKPDIVVANLNNVGVLINTSKVATTTALGASLNPSSFGQAVTFTATVTTSGSKAPTGTVTFNDGSTALGTGTLNGSGIATYTTSNLAVGQHSMTAVYGGDANNAGSTSSVLTQTVNAATTMTALVSSLNPSNIGQAVTFTATVTGQYGGTLTGTVTFMDGSTAVGTGTLNGSGVASYTTSNLAVGQQSMTAVYGGDVNNAGSTSSVLTQTVNAAEFLFTSNPTSATVTAGQSGTFTLTVTPQGSFTSPITFSCSGLPALGGCTFKPASVTPNSSTVTSTLTITTTAQTASLTSPFGRRSSPLYATWLVLPAMLLGTAGMAAPKRRQLLGYSLVFLLVGGCLLQAACGTGSNGSGTGGGGTPAGTYTVTVTAAAGSTNHTTAVTLTVQ